ncbi:MAG: menaquinone biosynthesis decarboxylase [Fimbriimonas ginsengisoli]|uniref:Menaquinone biosynthesis decarboxylase n=1 Tax=Fimbriimonas ginsengisoli TaxID=1005039 RepID=A0A931PWL1_FIMGI|nr:menaquinone biosynthesis decarboxylase [Fimbriimonas ginsengisoli]
MAYRDFQHFLEALEAKGELHRIAEPVSPYLEITEIADRVMKAGGPALLFERPEGAPHRLGTPDPSSAVMGRPSIHQIPSGNVRYEHPVAINTMGTCKRMSLALGVEDFEEHADRLRTLMKAEMPKGAVEGLKKLVQTLKAAKSAMPKAVGGGLCQEIEMRGEEIDLTRLPILTCWPEDAGPFITLPLVITHDPNTGKRNVGLYRIQLFDRNTAAMHWQMHKTGARHMEDSGAKRKPIEVAVALGGDPALTFAALAPLPPGIDEILFAGFLRQEGVRMTKARTVGLSVPADAEIVIEGTVDPDARRLEGPFGDHTGYYSLAYPFPVLRVSCVTMRRKAVYPATIVGVPPMEDGWMGKAVERIFLPLIQLTAPEIVDMNLPVQACFHNVAFVSIRKRYPGHAYKAMNTLWGLGALAFTKFVFVVDEDANVQDVGEMLFRIGANCDPGRDTLISKGPVDQLDHAAQEMGFGGKIGFDCTHKWPGENGFARDYPKLITMSEDVKRRVDELWPRLGL